MVATSEPLAHPLPALPAGSPFDSKLYKDTEAKFAAYVNGPRPAEWQPSLRYGMACAHNMYLTMIMRVYAFAEWAVEHDDLPNYLGFADTSFAQVDTHHHFEETEVFPLLASHYGEDVMAVSQAEHATFVCGLEAAWAYVRRCRANLSPAPAPSPIPEPEYEHLKAAPPRAGDDPDHPPVELLGSVFDPTLLRRQMDTWLPFMMTHLSNEVDILSDEMMERVGQKGYDEFVVMLNKHLMSRDPTWHPCGAVASCQMDVVGRFMQMPYFVRRVMLPFFWSGKYWGYWRYLPFPENLTFAGSGKV